jgi:hypothetical protein
VSLHFPCRIRVVTRCRLQTRFLAHLYAGFSNAVADEGLGEWEDFDFEGS